MENDKDQQKRAAAEAACEFVEDGMVVGIGTGTTAAFVVKRLGELVQNGLRVTGVPTSEATAGMARALGIRLGSLNEVDHIDLTIDGADEVDRSTLNLIKGRGGALLREKMVAFASDRMLVVVDESKIVDRLGSHFPVPVEVVQFGWRMVANRIVAQFPSPEGTPVLRAGEDGNPYVTDEGHYLLDCPFGEIEDPEKLSSGLKAIPGVVEHGLFLGLAKKVFVGSEGGVWTLPGR